MTEYFDAEAWARETATDLHYFDEDAATRACEFFPRYLKHTKGEWHGRPFELEPWEKNIVRAAFGWKRKSDNSRRFRIVYIEIPRKNGKTQLAAGIGLYLAFCDGEPGAEVYSVANDKDQACICFNEAGRMRKLSPAMVERTLPSKFSIFNAKYGQSYRPLSSEYGNKDGLNASGVIYDEFHAFRDRMLYDVMHTSTGSRRQPFELIITTAGIDKHSVCYETHRHAEQVRDKIITDDEFLPVIYAAGAEDDISDPAVWAKANPNLGKSIKLEYMRKQAEKARQQPSYENTFKRLHLNIWTEQEKRWLSMADWDRGGCDQKNLGEIANIISAEEQNLYHRRCYGGLDLARVNDLSCLALVFPPLTPDEKWKTLYRFWCPEDNIRERSERDRVPYQLWAQLGFIKPTPGNTTDFAYIEKQIIEDMARFNLIELAYDRTFAGELVNNLTQEGVPLVQFGQGFLSMASPTSELERMVLGGKIWHGSNPVARWNAANVTVQHDAAGNIKPDKVKSTDRIDGIVAQIMGLGRAIALTETEKSGLPGIAFLGGSIS